MRLRRNLRRLEPKTWAAIGVGTMGVGVLAWGVLTAVRARRTEVLPGSDRVPQKKPSETTPVGPPTPPTPSRPNLCDPTDPTKWPAGKVCAHDGERYVYMDRDSTPLPKYQTTCAVEIGDDHLGILGGEPHEDATDNGRVTLSSAVALDKNGTSFRLREGKRMQDWTHHDHAVALSAEELDNLRNGIAVYTTTSYDHDHIHEITLRCTKIPG